MRLHVLKDSPDKLGGHKQEVELVCEPLVRRDRRDVRVDEDSEDTLLFRRLDRLRARIVKPARLADGQAAWAQNEDLPSCGSRTCLAHRLVGFRSGCRDNSDKIVTVGALS